MNDQEEKATPSIEREVFINTSIFLEFGLLLIAFIIGHLANFDPISHCHFTLQNISLGVGWTIPLFMICLMLYYLPVASFQRIRKFMAENLGPYINLMNPLEIFILSLIVGTCEEVLFRGAIQPGFESWLHNPWAAILLANMIFACLHPLSVIYVVLVFGAGLYLSWMLDITGTRELSIPIVVHACYDWWVFMLIRRDVQLNDSMK
jgi:membrane protease YdiL (CAAX protease family)